MSPQPQIVPSERTASECALPAASVTGAQAGFTSPSQFSSWGLAHHSTSSGTLWSVHQP
ncbi:hypothetical protein [Sorangium sp. So ce381]|uniref:hypothetical protein n=1 Tax=Sorangium sp. So ce381 TaxID=3133307 RepID=UPI003F5B615E